MTEPLRDSDPREVGGYTLESRLGAGGMGTVYLARSATGEARAIKVLHAELSGSQESRSRLEREAAVLKRLRGDRSAAVYEINATAERPYLVMEYVSGLSLDKHIAKYGKLSGVLVWAVMDALLEAAEMFHAEGITHRDLKPSNVMLGEDGVKIIDFGISGLVGSSLTEPGSTPATTLWSSPEQIRGAEVGKASDIFNLGMIFAYAWTGRNPFEAEKIDAVILKLINGEPDLAGVPSRFSQIVSDCLAKDPAQRPSAREVRDRLRLISRSSSNSDSGSRSGDLGSSLTGTVIVNVAEEIQKRPREQLRQGAALKNRPVIYTAAAIAAVLVLGVVIVSRGDGGQSAPGTAPEVSVSAESSIPVRTLGDLRSFPRSSNPGPAEVRPFNLDLTEDKRHLDADKTNGTKGQSARNFDLKWFTGKCRAKFGTVEPHPPIVVQFSSPNDEFVAEFQLALDHIVSLLRGSGSVLADSLDGSFTSVGYGQALPPIISSIETSAQASNRNEGIKKDFGLADSQTRPLRITLSNSSRSQVDNQREAFSGPIRNLQTSIPSGFAVDYGWAVPAKRRTYSNPKEIDAAAVTISEEYWLNVSTEQRMATLARGLLLGLGSPVDRGPASMLSVQDGAFLRADYAFSEADFDIAARLGHEETNDC